MISLLQSLGYETDGLSSKSWSGFATKDAPEMDFVITTCDTAAGEQCPAFPGHPLQAHWGLPDPALVKGSEAEQRAAFVATYRRLASRMVRVREPAFRRTRSCDPSRIASPEIGRMEGATELTLSGIAA